ncbi:MAG: urea ABC transporter permease subunit UrtB [Rhodospirillales bacterium]|nr:urea ABC transporter permease subunit UrtB [Rhodospirillales bacterium]
MFEPLVRRGRLFAAAGLILFGLAAPLAAHAANFADAVNRLGSDGFAEKSTAIDEVSASGHPRAVEILVAMKEGRLYVRLADNVVVIGEEAAGAINAALAATGEDLGPLAAAAVSQIVVNNRLRAKLESAASRQSVIAGDATGRRKAAEALLKAPIPAAASMLRDALAKETDVAAKTALGLALAAVELSDPEPARRLAALAQFGKTSNPQVKNLIQARMALETDETVRAALAGALQGIEKRLALYNIALNLFQGISLGSVLLLAALGLAITFGVMGVINMAHGEMIMLGAYTAYGVQEIFRAFAPAAVDWYLPVAVPAAFLVAGAAGILIERTVIRWLYGRPLETLLATWGLSLILQQLVRTIFGAPNKEVANPAWMTGGIELAGGIFLAHNRIIIIVFCLAMLGVLAVAIRYSRFGLEMRAVTQNRAMADSMGIATGRIDALTFGLGSGLAGMAGVALSQIGNVSPNLGQIYIIDSFMVVVFGGVGSLWGTLVGAMSLGLVNKFLEPYAGAVLGKILVLVAIILFIQYRPRGLFALKGRAVEN